MDKTTKYCIIYAVLCMETSERLSVGMLAFDGDKYSYRYSQRKLDALEKLLPKKVHDFFCNVIKNLDASQLCSEASLDYMNRYSNNLLALSTVQSINMEYNKDTTDWLFSSFIDPVAA